MVHVGEAGWKGQQHPHITSVGRTSTKVRSFMGGQTITEVLMHIDPQEKHPIDVCSTSTFFADA